MADATQVQILREGVTAWNKWRKHNQKLNIDLSDTDLSGLQLSKVDFRYADLYGSDLSETVLFKAKLNNANLFKADLSRANLIEGNLFRAFLSRVDFTEANLSGANLSGASLQGAVLLKTKLEGTILNGCHVYGLSAWDVEGIPKEQSQLNIAPPHEPNITVEDFELAQFIYMLLDNKKVRDIIDTMTSKVVLILGRFTMERKTVLNCIREKLRLMNLTPIIFDFDKPLSKDFTGTIETLARLARFIIADITDPSSLPHELATIVPHLRTTPLIPIRMEGKDTYSMFDDFLLSYRWVLTPYIYKDSKSLIENLEEIIKPGIDMANFFRNT